MATTIIGMFDNPHDATSAIDDLHRTGISDDKINVVSHEKNELAERPIGRAQGGLVGALTMMGVTDKDANFFAEGVRRGSTLLALTVDADTKKVDEITNIMRRHGSVDIDQRAQMYAREGFTKFDETSQPFNREQMIAERERFAPGGEFAIPVIDEKTEIGKRAVETGHVRLHSRVIERPVDADVTLREEHIDVDRRKVDRPLTTDDMKAFSQDEIDLTERREEPVVRKEARVTEEVVVKRDVKERHQAVHETERHTEVDVERDDRTTNRPEV